MDNKTDNIDATPKNIRVFLVLLGVINLFLIYKYIVPSPGIVPAGIILAICAYGLIFPSAIKPLYIVWMRFGMGIGRFVNMILVTIVFFIIITPLSFVMKQTGRDTLHLSWDKDAETYWEKKPDTTGRESYLNQY
jgi:hypothetical protein